MLEANCKACGASFYVPQESAGEETRCGTCGKPVLVPVPETESPVSKAIVQEKVEGGWEYLILADRGRMTHMDQTRLNELGMQGWELITVYRDHPEANTTYYFKRPRQSDKD